MPTHERFGKLTPDPFDLANDLMSVDKYAVCPCGSGKKIKFCTKCSDSLGELDEVLKMIEGGQVVPALDRLSTILQEHPDAAWALAIRGRLLLDLREYETLTENAERFIRLQPSNPLALTQRAAASLFAGDSDKATESMLEALTESGRDVDAFVLDVASVLAYSLAQQGVFLTARVYATLAMMASGYEGGQTAMTVLRQLNSAPTISQLLKAVPSPSARPADVDWGERFDEASVLLKSNKVDLAEAKFASLRRTVPNEPAILSGQLTCAIWRGDVQAQADLFKKLSECESLDFEERARNRAIAALVNPESSEISVPVSTLIGDIKNADEVEMAFTSDSRFVALPADLLKGMKTSEDEVPPKSGFQILDRDKPESLEELPPVKDVPEAIAIVFVYGKQTDREARIEVLDVRQDNLAEVRQRIDAAADGIELKDEAGDAMPLLVAAQPSVAMIRFQANPADAERLQNELTDTRMPGAIASIELPILGGKSLASSAGDDSLLLERTAVMRIVEQYDAIASKGEEIIAEVYKLAKLEPQPALTPTEEEIELLGNEDLNRIDASGLTADSLVYLLQRSQQVSATPALRRFAKRMIEIDLTDEQKPAKLLAYMTLIKASEKNEEAIKLLDEAKEFATANEMSTANLLLSEVSLRLTAGDAAGFQNTIQTLTSTYGNQPEVMAQLQQMLVAYGLISPDGTPRGQGPAPAAAGAPGGGGGGELWTPDGGGSPSPAAGGGDGGGKLWVPGMD
ncbi:MAG: tetratricopeptide repeat protein [Rubripirellula sp.]